MFASAHHHTHAQTNTSAHCVSAAGETGMCQVSRAICTLHFARKKWREVQYGRHDWLLSVEYVQLQR